MGVGGGAGGGWTQMHRHEDRGMFSQCFCDLKLLWCTLQRCCANIWVCWTAKNGRKKTEERRHSLGTTSRRNRSMNNERWTDCWTQQRMKNILQMNDGRTFVLSLVLWSSLCTYRLSQPSVANLCSLFSLKKKIFLFSKFLLFYYLKTVVILMMLLMTMSILWIL